MQAAASNCVEQADEVQAAIVFHPGFAPVKGRRGDPAEVSGIRTRPVLPDAALPGGMGGATIAGLSGEGHGYIGVASAGPAQEIDPLVQVVFDALPGCGELMTQARQVVGLGFEMTKIHGRAAIICRDALKSRTPAGVL